MKKIAQERLKQNGKHLPREERERRDFLNCKA